MLNGHGASAAGSDGPSLLRPRVLLVLLGLFVACYFVVTYMPVTPSTAKADPTGQHTHTAGLQHLQVDGSGVVIPVLDRQTTSKKPKPKSGKRPPPPPPPPAPVPPVPPPPGATPDLEPATPAPTTPSPNPDVGTPASGTAAPAAATKKKRGLDTMSDAEIAANPDNVVMGMANGYGPDQIKQFVCSLRAAGYPGKIVFGLAQCDDATRAFYESADVTVELYDAAAAAAFGPDFMTYRFKLMAEYVRKYNTGNNLFLISDTRDAFFQRNPFEGLTTRHPSAAGGGAQWTTAPLHVFEEASYVTHGIEVYNSEWQQKCFGSLGPLHDKKILNGGVMFGTGAGVSYGLQTVFDAATAGHGCTGRDQAYLNRLFWTGQLHGAVAHEQGEPGAPMNVIGYLPRTDGARIAHPASVGDRHPGLLLDKDGYILDHDRATRTATLHQYDRFHAVNMLLHQKGPALWWRDLPGGITRCRWDRATRKPVH